MINGGEVVRIEVGKKRIGDAQGGIMNAQVFLQDLAASKDFFQLLCGDGAAPVVAAQIWESLFAFKNRRAADLFPVRAIGGNIGAEAATGQAYFQCAGRVAARLRPDQGQAFESRVRSCLAASRRTRTGPAWTCRHRYSFSHSISSSAQYVTMKSAPARLSDVMISKTAARSSTTPSRTAALTIANSPLT